MLPPNDDNEIFEKLPADVEHRIHEFLRIAEVCTLRCVSPSWLTRVSEALQRTHRWDLTHVEGVDGAAHVWLEYVSKAGVNARSVDLRVGNFEDVARDAALAGLAGAVEILIALCPNTAEFVNAADGDYGGTMLHYGAVKGHCDVVKLLVGVKNIDVNAANNNGNTPLHCAARENHRDVAELLVGVPNIDINAANNIGNTPLHCAAMYSNRDFVEFIVGLSNVDVSAANNTGKTPLHCAVLYYLHVVQFLDVVQFLVGVEGIDVNAADNNGDTALHFAAINGKRDIIELLVAAPNIDLNARNNRGWTPRHAALEWGNRDAAELLDAVPKMSIKFWRRKFTTLKAHIHRVFK